MSLRVAWMPVLLMASLPCRAAGAQRDAQPLKPDSIRTVAKLLPAHEGGNPLPELKWKSASYPVQEVVANGKPHLEVRLLGSFFKPNYTLIEGANVLCEPLAVEQRVEAVITLKGEKTPVHLVSIGPLGELIEVDFILEYPGFDSWAMPKKPTSADIPVASSAAPRVSGSAGLGFTLLSYRQTARADTSAILMTSKGSLTYSLVPGKWLLGVDGYFTLFPITVNQPDLSIRFLGLNAQVGYVVSSVTAPWHLHLSAGIYFATMFVTQDRLGYADILGPELYPSVSRDLASGASIGAYFKLSPILNQFRPLALESREIAVGGVWNFAPRANGSQVSLHLDLADLALVQDQAAARSTSFTLGVGYRW